MILPRIVTIVALLFLLNFTCLSQKQATTEISVDATETGAKINPFQYGQFIEHLGRAITGGIYHEGSALSDENGFRKDVMEKVSELRPALLRYPGGTFTKIYHWQDGVGGKKSRKKIKNLIWGGIEDNHFGTVEFIKYCRKIGAEPFLVVNMATGTPEEAANWVEYCNGTGDSHYANLRKEHGFAEPFNVKYWGIGNEEAAEPDLGRHQNVDDYIEDSWQYVKMMKLQDPHLKFIFVGTAENTWNSKVLDKLGPVCDYLSLHLYAIPADTTFNSLIQSVDQIEKPLQQADSLISLQPAEVKDFSQWYRFPPRQMPVSIAIDEWGIWDINSGKGTGAYRLEYQYNWMHALGVATFLNIFQRHSNSVGMATWAQTVNVLAPIMADSVGSYRQTIFAPLKAFRQYAGSFNLPTKVKTYQTAPGINAVDVATSNTKDYKRIVFTIVNRDARNSVDAAIQIRNAPSQSKSTSFTKITYTGKTLYSVNSSTEDNTVIEKETGKLKNPSEFKVVLSPASFTILLVDLPK